MIKFYLPESDDRVDPRFNFEMDQCGDSRVSGLDHDVYAHQNFSTKTCDGLLVTRSGIGTRRAKLIRETGGIHHFLRISRERSIIADSGAFQYLSQDVPPYDTTETVQFYDDLGFDFGITLDHLVLESDEDYDGTGSLLSKTPTKEMERRYRLTLDNAKAILDVHRRGNFTVKLLSAVQGWNTMSYAWGVSGIIDHVYVTLEVRPKQKPGGGWELIWIEELIEVAERSGSAPVYALLKRPDERFITMQAYDNPVFVEDVVRNAAAILKADPRVAAFSVRAVNHESIHDHNAFAVISED